MIALQRGPKREDGTRGDDVPAESYAAITGWTYAPEALPKHAGKARRYVPDKPMKLDAYQVRDGKALIEKLNKRRRK